MMTSGLTRRGRPVDGFALAQTDQTGTDEGQDRHLAGIDIGTTGQYQLDTTHIVAGAVGEMHPAVQGDGALGQLVVFEDLGAVQFLLQQTGRSCRRKIADHAVKRFKVGAGHADGWRLGLALGGGFHGLCLLLGFVVLLRCRALSGACGGQDRPVVSLRDRHRISGALQARLSGMFWRMDGSVDLVENGRVQSPVAVWPCAHGAGSATG